MFDPSKIPIPAELAPYTFPKVLSKRIGEWRECGTLDEILALKDGLSKDLAKLVLRHLYSVGRTDAALVVGFSAALALRGLALRFGWSLPPYRARPGRRPDEVGL